MRTASISNCFLKWPDIKNILLILEFPKPPSNICCNKIQLQSTCSWPAFFERLRAPTDLETSSNLHEVSNVGWNFREPIFMHGAPFNKVSGTKNGEDTRTTMEFTIQTTA